MIFQQYNCTLQCKLNVGPNMKIIMRIASLNQAAYMNVFCVKDFWKRKALRMM
jgi:hypothetical protein